MAQIHTIIHKIVNNYWPRKMIEAQGRELGTQGYLLFFFFPFNILCQFHADDIG